MADIREQNLTTVSDVLATDYIRLLRGGESRKGLASALKTFINTAAGTSYTLNTYTANRQIDTSVTVNVMDSSGGNLTATLPSAVNLDGTMFIIKKSVTANTVTVQPDGSETIDGAGSYTLAAAARDFVSVVSDGSNWQVIGA